MKIALGRWALAVCLCGLLMLALPLSVFGSGPDTSTDAKYYIQIEPPSGQYTDSALVTITLEDVNGTGFVLAEAKLGQGGDWTDITDDLAAYGMALLEIHTNGVVYVSVTDHTGYAHVQAQLVECFSAGAAAASSTPTESAVPTGSTGSGNPFTPDGTGTVLDNATDDDEKEFFTITTADENVFYLIVDRQRNSENVYFLNAVTEDDVLSLAQPGSSGESAIPVAEPEPEPQPEPDPEPEPEPEPEKSKAGSMLFIVIAVLAVGGAGYYFKILKPRQEAADSDDEDEEEYDEGYPDVEDAEEYLDEYEYLDEGPQEEIPQPDGAADVSGEDGI